MVMDFQSTASQSPQTINLIKDERNVVSTESSCKMVPLKPINKSETSYDFIRSGTINLDFLKAHRLLLVDIKFKAVVNKFPLPSDKVISEFVSLVDIIHKNKVNLKSYSPIEEGGLLFDFNYKELYYAFEFYNDFTASLYIADDKSGEPILMDEVELGKSLNIIKKYI